MKRTKIPTNLADNASKLHKRIGELLTSEESPYKHYEIRQEYPVINVNSSFSSGRERFDWAILGLKVICEVHGKQHYEPVCFGGITLEEAKKNFIKRQEVDELKRIASEEAGWAYIVIKYTEKDIDLDILIKRISEALEAIPNGVVAPERERIKIPQPKKYNWPKGRKIPGRRFNGEIIK